MEAVIFDMDGVLINSEPLWRRAMINGFSGYGMPITEDECRSTMGMRFREVVALWLEKHGKPADLAPEVDEAVVNDLIRLIDAEGKALDGVYDMLDFCASVDLKCGLATSSSERLMTAILRKLGLGDRFASAISAERLPYGKPHPEVFLRCAEELGAAPRNCIVIEDSLNGVVAAKAASMRVIAVPDDENLRADQQRVQQFTLADYRAGNMREALDILKQVFSKVIR